MCGMILGLLAETFVHPGVGQSDAAVDLPVAREKPTDYPLVPGSSVKGSLRQKAFDTYWKEGEHPENVADRLFGEPDKAGALLISDARLLLLPVRSLTGAYKWLTCPHLIERFRRDRQRQGFSSPPEINFTCLAGGVVMAAGSGKLFLEECNFVICGGQEENLETLAGFLGAVIADSGVRGRLKHQLAVVSDDDFAWFARHALPVDAHNSLARDTKKSQALWYEETLPPDTAMYVVVEERTGIEENHNAKDPLQEAMDLFAMHGYLRLGGNETTGQGWFRCCCLHE
ncbi:MAG: type III-B CRISPR module RAMP protein Cmr4 [Magnetococcales bacterium]|nr:type III-B CRISPR module RAMP protein Cmr4 [Magnetococcales bacterium]MBF0323300.1 type III-B CRISPR module RAMP protein Cmr4 [Magnetococcales bacterium]